MAKCYQYNASGWFAGEVEDHGLLPNNATHTPPQMQNGYIPRFSGGKWELVENHRGKQGYLNGQPHTIKEYGPLPDGWSTDPPPLTIFEQVQAVQARYQSVLNTLLTALSAANALDDAEDAAVIKAEYAAMLTEMETEIETITG